MKDPTSPARPVSSPDEPIKVVDRRWWARDESAAEAEPGWEPAKPTYVEELERQLAEKDRQIQEYLGRYREAASEFEATRARMRREIGKEIERGRRTLLVELLEVLDNLDRALAAAGAGTGALDAAGAGGSTRLRQGYGGPPELYAKAEDSPYVRQPEAAAAAGALIAGVRLVRDQFLAKLEGFGVRPIEPVGQPFDPTRHEAVTIAPAADPSQDGVVIGVIQRGYMIGDEVLRPAMVAVARSQSETSQQSGNL